MIYLCLLILCVGRVTSRVAVNEQKDDLNHLIKIKPVEDKHNVNSNPSETSVVHNNLIVGPHLKSISTEAPKKASCISSNDLERSLNGKNNKTSLASKSICNVKANKPDNGTALLLTEYIKSGRKKEARTASKVDSSIFLGIKSYSGFFTVNETYNSNIFFWYFPVLNKAVNDSPWIIWLQGGPGASSLTGLFDEIGPFTVVNDSLKLKPCTWLRNHSILFIDNPVGTGYSFTDHADGYVTDMATYASHLYSTLKQFLEVFPELKTVPLYLAGESYAGKYVPAMAMEIHRRNHGKEDAGINLQGMIIGNAYVDPDMISHVTLPFYYFGLLEKEQIEIVQPLVDLFNQDIKANKSVEAKNKWNSLITLLVFLTHQKHAYNFLRDDFPVGKYVNFLKTSDVKKALHVGDIKFGFVNMTVNTKLAPDFLSTTKPLFERLLVHYKVLAYCGQLDQMLPCVFTSENYRTWKWNGTDEFVHASRFPYIYDNKLAGYHKSGGHLTEVVIRGAGHMVPLDVPAPTQNLVARWTHGKPLSLRYGMLLDSFVQEYIANNSLIHYL